MWIIVHSGNDLHVIPVNDKKPHQRSADCECEPTVEVVGAGLVIVHDAFDFRHIADALEEESSKDGTK